MNLHQQHEFQPVMKGTIIKIECSSHFRPKRSAKQQLKYLREKTKTSKSVMSSSSRSKPSRDVTDDQQQQVPQNKRIATAFEDSSGTKLYFAAYKGFETAAKSG